MISHLQKKFWLEKGFIFNQISKLTKRNYSNLSHENIHFYLKLRIPIIHRHFFKKHLKVENKFKLIAMIEKILFILNVPTGIYILIHNVSINTPIQTRIIGINIRTLVQRIIITPIPIYSFLYL